MAAQPHTAIARQAIINTQLDVVAYELFDRSHAPAQHTAASDAQLLFNVLLHAEHHSLLGHKALFINCTFNSLIGEHLALINPERVVLEIPPLPDANPEAIAAAQHILSQLHARGFKLAFNQSALTPAYATWLPLAAFIKLNLNQLKHEPLGPWIERARQHSRAELIAEQVETQAQFELAAAYGITLFQGFLFAHPEWVPSHTIRPAPASMALLIELLAQPDAMPQIEHLFKRDPILSFNLLRFIHSAGLDLGCEISSLAHALQIMGPDKMQHWARLLLATSSEAVIAPPGAQDAVVRGRLMELLATELLPAEECENAFMVGAFSLLNTMLRLPMNKVLEAIALPAPVLDTLVLHQGLFAPLLDLALACESSNEVAFSRLCEQLQLTSHQVNWAHLQAIAWAEAPNTLSPVDGAARAAP